MMTRVVTDGRARRDAALLVLLAAAVAFSFLRIQPVSAVVVLTAMSLVPGAAFLTRAGTSDPLTTVALALGLSLAVDTAVATAMAWSGWWHPELAAATIAAGAAALLITDLRRILASPSAQDRRA